MKVVCIDHIAVAVNVPLKEAEEHFETQLGAKKIMTVTREDKKYTVSYMGWGTSCLTLVHPDFPECFINKDIARKGVGLHHMGIEVEDLDAAEAEFIAAGGVVGPKEAIPGVRREFVVAPKNNCGVLLQVIEYDDAYKGIGCVERYGRLAAEGHLPKL